MTRVQDFFWKSLSKENSLVCHYPKWNVQNGYNGNSEINVLAVHTAL